MGGHGNETEREVKAHERPRVRTWLLLVGIIGLVAGHSVVLYYIQKHAALSAAVLSGVVALVVIKHLGLAGPLYAALRSRSSPPPANLAGGVNAEGEEGSGGPELS